MVAVARRWVALVVAELVTPSGFFIIFFGLAR